MDLVLLLTLCHNTTAGIKASDNATTSASGAESAVRVCLRDCHNNNDALLVR